MLPSDPLRYVRLSRPPYSPQSKSFALSPYEYRSLGYCVRLDVAVQAAAKECVPVRQPVFCQTHLEAFSGLYSLSSFPPCFHGRRSQSLLRYFTLPQSRSRAKLRCTVLNLRIQAPQAGFSPALNQDSPGVPGLFTVAPTSFENLSDRMLGLLFQTSAFVKAKTKAI